MDTEALNALCDRAESLALKLSDETKRCRCVAMMAVLRENVNWPDLKIGGWLEHVVTICIENGVTSIDEERSFSRPIKHAYFKRCGFDIPKTTDVLDLASRA